MALPGFKNCPMGSRPKRKEEKQIWAHRPPELEVQTKVGLGRMDTPPAEWWAIVDSNHGPQSYQDCALTT